MKVHFIAIGGSAMHNLALALHLKGYTVTGSDDEIFEPAKSRLAAYNLLPAEEGWFPEMMNDDIDAVILGMHAKADNPELLKARELGLKIYSYPEFLYNQSVDKTRIVIGGSHGKTTITAMILHVLKLAGIEADYMVGAQLRGFDVMVRLSETARYMIFEGDEYLTSPLDPRPKFHLYRPHIAVISGIAWDHINVFPVFDNYLEQFRGFITLIEKNGSLIYCTDDQVARQLCESTRDDLQKVPYSLPETELRSGIRCLKHGGELYPLQVFGKHNLLNIMAAYHVCKFLGVDDATFYKSIATFTGAANRLECIATNEKTSVFKDFAHAPSKVRATTQAVKEQYPHHQLWACLELHTFSSLSKDFLSHYQGSMDLADKAIVYFNPHAVRLKKLPALSKEDVSSGFQRRDLLVFDDSAALKEYLLSQDWNGKVALMMSSGNFDGIDLKDLAWQMVR